MKNGLTGVFGLNFLTGSVHGCLFEDLCHALITRPELNSDVVIPEHDFELVNWSAGGGLHLDPCGIEQIAIPTLTRIQSPGSKIPGALGESWYWIPATKRFTGVDSIFYDANARKIYLIQITIDEMHPRVSLSDISNALHVWQGQGLTITFVTLVDSRDRQRIFLKRTNEMIQRTDPWFRRLPEVVGVLCSGPADPQASGKTLADFIMELVV
jgi:hypothetical protein